MECPQLTWLAYGAMATALVPLVLMGIGYLFIGKEKTPRRP